MKKLFVGILAIASLVACAQEEVLRTQAPGQISFDSYVDNAVRTAEDPSYGTANALQSFDVWGYMDKTAGVVFDRETVSGGAGNWSYTNIQYWVPGHIYRFFALAPAGTQNVEYALGDAYNDGLGEITFTNLNGTEDLLYASATATTPASIETQPDAVLFAFDHLLSKVKFSFTNGITNDNAYIQVKNIKMDVPLQGTVNLDEQDAYTWANHSGVTTLSFGDMDKAAKIAGNNGKGECDYERLTIPAGVDQKYRVTFDVVFYMGDVVASTASKVTYIEGCLLEPGKAYNFTATLNQDNVAEDELFPITFEATVDEWVDGGIYDGDGNITIEDVVSVSSADELAAAAAVAGANIALAENVETGSVALNGANLNGNGNTVTPVAGISSTTNYLPFIKLSNGGTIKNITIDGKDAKDGNKGIRGIFIENDGDYTIENATVLNCTYPINTMVAAPTGTIYIKNSVLQSWASFDDKFTVICENVEFRVGTYANFRPYYNATLKGCQIPAGFTLDLTCLIDGAVLTIEQSYYNGELITAENVANIEWFGGSYDASKVVVK